MGRDGQAILDHPLRLVDVVLVEVPIGVDVGDVEVIGGHLELLLTEHLPIGDARRVLHVLEVGDALLGHHDALDAVGEARR